MHGDRYANTYLPSQKWIAMRPADVPCSLWPSPQRKMKRNTGEQMRHKTGLTAILIALTATSAPAHNGATGVVLERMKGMSAMRDVMRDLAPIIQGAAPYDALAISEGGYLIAAHSGETMRALFPENSLSGVTYAKPNIWAEWQEFAALADDLRIYGEKLTSTASIGLELPPPAPLAEDETAAPDPQIQRSRKIARLLGYSASGRGETALAEADLVLANSAEYGAEAVFTKISGTCSACHARFRTGRN